MNHEPYTPDGMEGVAACRRCGGFEGCLPTDCPGYVMSMTTQDAVYDRKVDYADPIGWFVPTLDACPGGGPCQHQGAEARLRLEVARGEAAL